MAGQGGTAGGLGGAQIGGAQIGGAQIGGALTGLFPAPPKRPRPAFALTPLADVMFQLLIFFMLSSSLAPYAMLSLDRTATTPDANAEPAGAAPTITAPTAPVIWQLGRGEVRAGTDRLALDDLAAALADLNRAGVPEVLILTTAAARTADLVRLLELVRGAGPIRARILGQGG